MNLVTPQDIAWAFTMWQRCLRCYGVDKVSDTALAVIWLADMQDAEVTPEEFRSAAVFLRKGQADFPVTAELLTIIRKERAEESRRRSALIVVPEPPARALPPDSPLRRDFPNIDEHTAKFAALTKKMAMECALERRGE